MPLLPEFPISGDDYTVGFLTTTAGKKEFVAKDSYLNSFGGVRPGDHIYISTVGKILVIGSITGENSGTLTDPCPDDCAVTDLPVRIFFKTASSRVQGRIAMLLEKFSKGYLAAFSEIRAEENQFFQTTNIPGEMKAVYLTADKVKETDTRKVMTADERNKLAGIAGLEQSKWNNGSDTTEALISPLKFLATLDAMGVWRGGYRFGTATSGGFVLPNGMIVQFGTTWPPATDYRMNFPLTFPNACGFFTVIGAYNIDTNRYIAVSTSNVGAGGADIRSRDIYGGSVGGVHTFPCYWFAVGF